MDETTKMSRIGWKTGLAEVDRVAKKEKNAREAKIVRLAYMARISRLARRDQVAEKAKKARMTGVPEMADWQVRSESIKRPKCLNWPGCP